jgi:hypothetical protein
MHRRAIRYLCAAAILATTTVVVFAPLVRSVNTGVLTAEATDAKNAIRGAWLTQHAHASPFTLSHDPYNGAPEGTPLVPAVNLASPTQPLVSWSLSPIIGLITTFNLFLLLGVAATAFVAFVLLDCLGFAFTPSLIGSYIVAFNPWSIERAVAGAPAFNHAWCLILLLAALIALYRKPSMLFAVLAGAAYASCFLVAAYFGLIGAAFVIAFVIASLTQANATQRVRRTVRNLAIMAAVTVVPLIPALVVFATENGTTRRALSNPTGELVSRGAAPVSSYLLPSPRNPVLGTLVASLQPSDPLREKVLFFGYTTIALAIAGFILLVRGTSFTPTQKAAMRIAAISVPVAYLLSLPRSLHLLGVTFYSPTYLIGLITSFYRVYARVGYAAGIAATILAVAALDRLSRRPRGQILVLLVGALIVFEFLPGTLPVAKANHPPAYDAWLAQQPRGIVVHYPLPTDNELALILGGDEYYNQRFTNQRNFNLFGAGIGGTREEGIRLLARYPTDPLTPRILAAEGVRYVVIHDDIYTKLHLEPPQLGPPFRQVKTIGDTRIFTLVPRPDAHYIDKVLLRSAPTVAALEGLQFGTVTVGPEGFLGPERYHNVFGWRWMQQAGVLHVHNPYDHPMKFRLFAHAFSNSVPRTIEVDSDAGTKLSSFRVPTFERALALRPLILPPGDTQLNLFADPEPQRLGLHDKRIGSIYLGPVRAVPVSTVSLRNQ